MKRFIALILVLSMAFAFYGCTVAPASVTSETESVAETTIEPSAVETTEATAQPEKKYDDIRIGVILPIGGRGDNSLGDGVYNGVSAAAEKLGFQFDYSEPVNEQDREALILEYSESGEYDLVIAAGSEVLTIVEENQSTYPDQKYLIYDVKGAIPNTMTEWFNKAELGFIAGVFMAAMDPYGEVQISGATQTWTPSGKFGLIIGGEYPSTITTLTGAAAGIKYINPDNDYMYGIVGNWSDQAKNKELALSMYAAGCNFVFHNSGGGSAGVLNAAIESNRFMIGYDANQNIMSATNILASSHKNHVDVFVRVLTEFCENGTLNWGGDEENNYSNSGAAFTINDGVVIPDAVTKILDDVRTKLANGEIVIPSTWEEVDVFSDTYAG